MLMKRTALKIKDKTVARLFVFLETREKNSVLIKQASFNVLISYKIAAT